MQHATAATPATPSAPTTSSDCVRPGVRLFPVMRFGRAVRTSLPLVIAGTLAVSATAIPAPAHAAPVESSTAPGPLLQPTVPTAVAQVTASQQAVLRKAVSQKVVSQNVPSQRALPAKASPPAPQNYTVVSGDTVSEIADRFGLKTQAILAANGLDTTSIIFPGQRIRLAAGSAHTPAKESATTKYTVRSGDTMSGIAERTGSRLSALLTTNRLVTGSVIFPGQIIVVPGAESSPAPAPAAAGARTHTVAPGDTMSGIAEKAGTSLGGLLAANGLVPASIIYPGQKILVPGADFSLASTVTPAASDPRPEITMTAERRANAETVIRVGRGAGVSDYGIVIALAAAMQESGLKNVDHGDRDSLGIFQQRPSTGWGTPAQTRDPERAARAFFGGERNPNPGVTRGLLDIPGWQKMTVSQAAQAVQISGWPNHYAKWETAAREWLEELG